MGIIADIHYSDEGSPRAGTEAVGFVAEPWTKEAIKEWEEWGADFAIQLGDCSSDHHPDGTWRSPENSLNVHKYFYDNIWVSDKIPLYNVLGNHEIGVATKSDILALWHLPKSPKVAYYSFGLGAFHFVVLDNQNYECADKQDANWAQHHFRIWDEQKNWLINDLKNTSKPTIIFIHVPLSGKFYPFTRVRPSFRAKTYSKFFPVVNHSLRTLYRFFIPRRSTYNRIINCIEIQDILESCSHVIAVFEAHYHNPSSNCLDAYHWSRGRVHYFGVTCPANKYTIRSRGFLTLDPVNRQLKWAVVSDHFTRNYEFGW